MKLIGKEIVCRGCGKEFKLPKNTHLRKYCSLKCYGKNRIGPNSPSWKGGKAKCVKCGKRMSYYRCNKEMAKDPICMKCRKKGFNPWGKEHFNFKGYCTSKNRKERLETWKRKLLERDKYQCINCGYKNMEVLQGAHIIAKSIRPDLAIDLNNGITLCANCHILFDKGLILSYLKKGGYSYLNDK